MARAEVRHPRGTPPITPVVLVGGRSSRFGRDKLLEPIADGVVMVDAPIRALRSVFGPRVIAVGNCDPGVAGRADGHLADDFPGAGPLGGTLSALRSCPGDVMVLAGDLVRFDANSIQAILAAAEESSRAIAVLANAGRVHWCAGLYRQACVPRLSRAIDAHERALHRALADAEIVLVDVPEHVVANANSPKDLRGILERPGP